MGNAAKWESRKGFMFTEKKPDIKDESLDDFIYDVLNKSERESKDWSVASKISDREWTDPESTKELRRLVGLLYVLTR